MTKGSHLSPNDQHPPLSGKWRWDSSKKKSVANGSRMIISQPAVYRFAKACRYLADTGGHNRHCTALRSIPKLGILPDVWDMQFLILSIKRIVERILCTPRHVWSQTGRTLTVSKALRVRFSHLKDPFFMPREEYSYEVQSRTTHQRAQKGKHIRSSLSGRNLWILSQLELRICVLWRWWNQNYKYCSTKCVIQRWIIRIAKKLCGLCVYRNRYINRTILDPPEECKYE